MIVDCSQSESCKLFSQPERLRRNHTNWVARSAHGGGHVNGGAWKSSFEDRDYTLVIFCGNLSDVADL